MEESQGGPASAVFCGALFGKFLNFQSCQDGNGEIEFEELCMLEIKMSGARPRADLIDAGLAVRSCAAIIAHAYYRLVTA